MPARDHAQWRVGHNRWMGQTAVPCRSASIGENDPPYRFLILLTRTQLPVLALKFLDAQLLGSGLAWPLAAIALDLTGPDAKAVRRTTLFDCNRCQRRSFAPIIVAVFHRQPNRTFAELRSIRLRGLLLFLFHNGQFSQSFALRYSRGSSGARPVRAFRPAAWHWLGRRPGDTLSRSGANWR